MNKTKPLDRSIRRAGWLALAGFLLLTSSAQGMYDPHHGRWFQRDPLGVRADMPRAQCAPTQQYGDSTNLHEYVQSNATSGMDPAGQEGRRKLVSTENLNLAGPAQQWTQQGGTGRAATERSLGPASRCREIFTEPTYNPFHPARAEPTNRSTIDVIVDANVHVGVVGRGHQVWRNHLPRYDSKWGNPRSDDRERDATIAHEYDHRDTYVIGFWPNIYSGKLARFERISFCGTPATSCCCVRVAECLNAQIWELWGRAIAHSRSFDMNLWNLKSPEI